MSKKEKDCQLPELYMLKDKTVEEISKASPGLDEEAFERITKLCEKKMGIASSESMNTDNREIKAATVKKSSRPLCHRVAFATAACLVLVSGFYMLEKNIDTKPADDKLNTDVSKQSMSEVSETTLVPDKTIPQVSEPSKIVPWDQAQQYIDIFEQQLEKYDEVNAVMSCIGEKRAEADYDDVYIKDGKKYYRVMDTRFSNAEELYEFIETVYSKDIEKTYRISTPESNFVESEGKLYIVGEPGKGFLFNAWMDIQPQISDVNEDTFTVVKGYIINDDSDKVGLMKFVFVNEEGEWKLSTATPDGEVDAEQYQKQMWITEPDNNFILSVDKISAEEIFDCDTSVNMPDTIDGCGYYVMDICDEESVYVYLFEFSAGHEILSGARQAGIYNFRDGSYAKLLDLSSNQMPSLFSENYIVIINNDEGQEWYNNTPTLSYYDINDQTEKIIYDDVTSSFSGLFIHDDAVYFGLYRYFETTTDNESSVYKFDFSTDELTLLCENALMPVIKDDSVAVFISDNETGEKDTLKSIEGNDFSCHIDGLPICAFSANNTVYGKYQADGVYKFGVLESQTEILRSSPLSNDINIYDWNDDFIAFGGDDMMLPHIYDIKQNRLLEFDNLSETKCHEIYVRDKYGIINYIYSADKHKLVFFKIKDE